MNLNMEENVTEILLIYFLKTIAELEVTMTNFQKYLKILLSAWKVKIKFSRKYLFNGNVKKSIIYLFYY